MKKSSYLLLLFFYSLQGVSQTPEVSKSTESTVFNDTSAFSTLDVSYYGTTQQCEAYNIYGFKYKRKWFLAIKENDNIRLLITNPPRSKSKIYQSSSYFIEGISKNIKSKYIYKKKRRKTVRDIDLYGFYKFNKYGKEVVEGLFYLEFPIIKKEKKGFPGKLLKKIFNKDIKKAKDAAGAIKPNVKVNDVPIELQDLPIEVPNELKELPVK